MKIVDIWKKWGMALDEVACLRDAFEHLLLTYPENCLFVDICPKTVDSGKYYQFCHTWQNYRVFKHRNSAYIANENKFADFMRTIWLYSDVQLISCNCSRKGNKKIATYTNKPQNQIDDVKSLESLLRYALRHELEEICFFFSDMETLVFPMGTCLLLFTNNTLSANMSLIQKIANVSGLYIRFQHSD